MITLPGIFAYLPQDIQDIIIAILDALYAEENLLNGFMQRQTAIESLKAQVFKYQQSSKLYLRSYCLKCQSTVKMYNRILCGYGKRRVVHGICKTCNFKLVTYSLSRYEIYFFGYAFDEDTISEYSTKEIQSAIINYTKNKDNKPCLICVFICL
jgi:hypothetical protein